MVESKLFMKPEWEQHVAEIEEVSRRLGHLKLYAALIKAAASGQGRSPQEILREDLQQVDPKLFALLKQSLATKDDEPQTLFPVYRYQTPFGELIYDRERLIATSPLLEDGSQLVVLTSSEGIILEELITHPDQVVNHTSLIKVIYNVDGEFGDDKMHALRVYMARLRQKLGDVAVGGTDYSPIHRLIHTIPRRGYTLSPQAPTNYQ